MSAVERPLVEFYFDFACPWSFLAVERVHESALRTGARVVWRPVFVADVLAVAGPRPAGTADRDRYRDKDLRDWLRYCGLDLRRDPPWDQRLEWPSRAICAAAGRSDAPALVAALFAAWFTACRPLDGAAAVLDVVADAGLEPAPLQGMKDPACLEQVRSNARDLLARGGFDVPTMLVGTDLYFGNDRMPLVEAALARAGSMRLVLPGAHGS
jgi:2-hydroxychromene-2-carboxylate isomerase